MVDTQSDIHNTSYNHTIIDNYTPKSQSSEVNSKPQDKTVSDNCLIIQISASILDWTCLRGFGY